MRTWLIVLVIAGVLAGAGSTCTGADNALPQAYGLYAVDSMELTELRAGSQATREFSPTLNNV